MAALFRSTVSSSGLNFSFQRIYLIQKAFLKNEALRTSVRGTKPSHEVDSDVRFPDNQSWNDSLFWQHTSSFWRRLPEYHVPDNVDDLVNEACDSVLGAGSYTEATSLSDPSVMGAVLLQCERRLNHQVPNNMLHQITCVGDVRRYFHSSVDQTSPLDKLAEQDLPKNMSVMTEYHRFNPETDVVFGGISAYPGSSTVVTNIKYKQKYKGYTATKKYPWNVAF